MQKCNKDVIKDGKVISEDEIIGASQLMYKHGKNSEGPTVLLNA